MRRSADFLHIMRSKTLYILYRARSTSVELRTRINLARAYRWCEAGHQPATVTYELRIFHRHTTVTEAAYIRSPFRLIINLKVRLFVTWRRRDVGHTYDNDQGSASSRFFFRDSRIYSARNDPLINSHRPHTICHAEKPLET